MAFTITVEGEDIQLRPMLAHTDPVEPHQVVIGPEGVWVSPKLDGVRCLGVSGVPRSRKLKVFPNRYVQRRFAEHSDLLHGLDGELVVGSPTHPLCISNTTSGVMSRGGEPDFGFYVFDRWDRPSASFRTRYIDFNRHVSALQRRGFPAHLVPQIRCYTVEQIEEAVASFYEMGYEGAIVRSFICPYKYNRSTLREGYMLKIKDSIDFEVRITDFLEMRHNQNEATVNELGLTKRSTHKANKIAAGTLGKMIGVRVDTGAIVTVGTGKMTDEEKLEVWLNQDLYRDKISKSRAAKHGTKDKPRHPRHIVWRDPIDM